MAEINLQSIRKRYEDGFVAIDNLNLQIEKGEFLVFVGPSGCGKSTLLRMIAGLEKISDGELLFDGKKMNDIAPGDRGISMVFQNYALYPHMTVYDNMAFGLRNTGVGEAEIKQRIEYASKQLQMDHLLQRKPREMSGGQQQRVAIGRSIVRKPEVFLFDEPLSNLDAALRQEMRTEISMLHERLDTTMIYVTHDQVEAMTMADRIVVMKAGQIQQVGTPMEIYQKPANLFVAQFIGAPKINTFDATYDAQNRSLTFSDTLTLQAGNLSSDVQSQKMYVAIRPNMIRIVEAEQANFGQATIRITERLGDETILFLEREDGSRLSVKTQGIVSAKSGQQVHLSVNEDDFHLFDENELRV